MIDTLYTIYTSYDKLLQYDIKHDTSKLLYCTAISRIDSCAEKITQYDITDQDLSNLYRIRKILWNRLCANGWDVNYERVTTYKISAINGTGYTITPTGIKSVTAGDNISYTILPSSGYSISQLLVDGNRVYETGLHQYTFENVQANHSISAIAAEIVPLSITITGVTTAETGGTVALTASVTPSDTIYKTVTWSSSNLSLATVSSTGVVTTLTAGTVVITATAYGGITATHSIVISTTVNSYTVTSTKTTGFSVSPLGAQTVTEGSSLTFTFTATTGYALQYAILDGIRVSPDFSNTSTATYSLSDIITDHSVTASVYVVVPTSISISGTSSVYVGSYVQLTATVLPSNALNKTVTWSVDNSSVATVSSAGLVTGIAAGTAVITATTSNGLTTTKSVVVSPVQTDSIYYGYITYAEWVSYTTGTTYASVTKAMCTGSSHMVTSALTTMEMQPIVTTLASDMMCIAIPASSSYVCKKYQGIGSGDSSYMLWNESQVGANGIEVDFEGTTYKIYGQYTNVPGTTYFQIK